VSLVEHRDRRLRRVHAEPNPPDTVRHISTSRDVAGATATIRRCRTHASLREVLTFVGGAGRSRDSVGRDIPPAFRGS
jgi:hypothetical protein